MDFFTADTHFGHVNILRYCDRPFASAQGMDAALIARWNRRVGPEDTVYHLGDFALGPRTLWPEYRRQLNGRIVFIIGNHDAPLDKFQQMLQPGDTCHVDYRYQSSSGLQISLAHAPPAQDEPQPGRKRLSRSNSFLEVAADVWFCGHVHGLWAHGPCDWLHQRWSQCVGLRAKDAGRDSGVSQRAVRTRRPCSLLIRKMRMPARFSRLPRSCQ